MKKTKKFVLVAVSLVVVGLLIAAAGLVSVHFDFTKLSLGKLTCNTHNIEEDFTKISIDTDINDIWIAPSKDGTCQVICLEEVEYFHNVSVENHTLTITCQDDRMWYEQMDIDFGNFHSITVFLPKKAYEELTVHCDTADVEVSKEFSFGWVDVTTDTGDIKWQGSTVNNFLATVDTGNIYIADTGCQTLSAKTDTGDIRLKDVIISQNLTAKTDTGDVRFDSCDAKAMSVHTGTGDVTGTLLSNKIFITETNTGKVVVPSGGFGEILTESGEVITTAPLLDSVGEITTDTGDIRIEVID